MNLQLLESGIGIFEGGPTAHSYDDAASQLVAQVLGQRRNTDLPLRALFLMATPEWCSVDESLSRRIRKYMERSLNYKPTLFGLGVPCAYVAIPRGGRSETHSIEKGAVLIAFFSNDLFVTVDACERPHADHSSRRSAVTAMVQRILAKQKEHIGLGSGAKTDLFAIFPGPYLNEVGVRVYFDSELHQEVLEAFDDQPSLFGGAAANELMNPTLGYQFHDDRCLESSLVVASFEYDFEIDGRMEHGFQPVGQASVSVDGLASQDSDKDYVVTVLDEKPALQRLRELSRTNQFSTSRPVLGLGASNNAIIVTPISPLSEEIDASDTAVRFNRAVTKGYRLSVLRATPDELQANSVTVLRTAGRSLEKHRRSVKLLLGMACIGRFSTCHQTASDPSWWAGINDFSQQYPEIPVVFGLVAGEFGPDSRRRPRADNLSVWIAWFTATPNPRSAERLKMLELLRIADGLTQHANVDAVMKASIDIPMQHLSLGGQICTVHDRFGKILGEGHGYSNSKADCNGVLIDHDLIRKGTNRQLAPEGAVYSVPPVLRQWTRPTGTPTRPRMPFELDPYGQAVDILPFCVANRAAIFVPDVSDAAFMCDRELVSDGGLAAQFVMPLAGREGKIIGTLQIYFERGYVMSREEMDHWISYGQKVGVALDSAIQAASVESSRRLHAIVSEAMKRCNPKHPIPVEAIQGFLEGLRDAIQADYVHARIRERPESADRYRLIAPKGDLAEEHARVRPNLIRVNEGSLFHLLEREIYSSSTREETLAAYSRQPELLGNEPWKLLDNEYTTFWMAALKSPNKTNPVLGCLVVHSKKEHFFTRFKSELLQSAALALQNMVARHEAEYVRGPSRERMRSYIEQELNNRIDAHRKIDTQADAIRLASQIAEELHPEDEVLREQMARIRQNASAIRKTFIQASRPSEEMRVPTFVEHALEHMSVKVEPVIEIDSCLERTRIPVHRFHTEVLQELLKNAHTAVRGTSDRIWLKVSGAADMSQPVELTIENEGPEVTYEDIDLWRQESFSTKKDPMNSGEGLALIGTIIDFLEESLIIRPRPAGGVIATFTITTSSNRR